MNLLGKLDRAFFCDYKGDYSAAKIISSIGQGLLLSTFYQKSDIILRDWDILALFIVAFIAPDILKKVITMKFGRISTEGEERTTTHKFSRNHITTESEEKVNE